MGRCWSSTVGDWCHSFEFDDHRLRSYICRTSLLDSVVYFICINLSPSILNKFKWPWHLYPYISTNKRLKFWYPVHHTSRCDSWWFVIFKEIWSFLAPCVTTSYVFQFSSMKVTIFCKYNNGAAIYLYIYMYVWLTHSCLVVPYGNSQQRSRSIEVMASYQTAPSHDLNSLRSSYAYMHR